MWYLDSFSKLPSGASRFVPIIDLAKTYWSPFLSGAACSALILWVLLTTGLAWSLATDIPTHRSLHTRPTPRVGGWGVSSAAVLGLFVFAPDLKWVALIVLALAALCQIDDRRGLSARVRFAAQTLAAIVVCLVYLKGAPLWVLPILVIALVWGMNLYNFMDGADGLAGGMALIGFGAYALAATAVAPTLALASCALAGAAAGFLLFNFPPASIFLGDAGSIPLGFLAGSLGVIGWSMHVWPFWFPVMVFSPFIADATMTLLRRVSRGERFWEAHRQHYYQHMIQMGTGHRPTIIVWYGLILLGVILALAMLALCRKDMAVSAAILGAAWICLLIWLGLKVDRRWHQFSRPDGKI
jgi:UDP-N-acetylmuramyl pentapeptide phosphotransferase/UDP-N-acetylglucosamine-1-phosphate transferase